MNTANFPAMILALSLPCAAAPAPAPEYSAKHKETASKLAVQQDELQADTSDLILGETNEEVVELLKKCRHAMNDAVDLLEVYNTGGQTLAAQSDVIELIYQAAKAKMTGADGQPKPGGRALMDMLRQLLGMDHDAQSAEQQEGDEKGQEGSQKGSGNNSGRGTNGKSNMASSQDKGVSNPDTAVNAFRSQIHRHVRRRHAFRIPQGAGRLQQDFTEVKRPSPDTALSRMNSNFPFP